MGSAQRELLILVDQLRAIDNQQRVAALAHAFAACCSWVALYGRVPTILLGLVGLGASRMHRRGLGWSVAFRRAVPGIHEARVWAFRRTWFTLALGGSVGNRRAALLSLSGDMASQALIMMVVTGLAAGALTVSAIYLACIGSRGADAGAIIIRSALEENAALDHCGSACHLPWLYSRCRAQCKPRVKQSLNIAMRMPI